MGGYIDSGLGGETATATEEETLAGAATEEASTSASTSSVVPFEGAAPELCNAGLGLGVVAAIGAIVGVMELSGLW